MGWDRYTRVIPRDLFNEANLLKCYGRLEILLGETGHDAAFRSKSISRFRVLQSQDSGAITVANLLLTVRGVKYRLLRPLNSRDAWPLWVDRSDVDPSLEEIRVFDEDGNLSADMLAFIRGVEATVNPDTELP